MMDKTLFNVIKTLDTGPVMCYFIIVSSTDDILIGLVR